MSSFVIDKASYMKAAGVVAAVADVYRNNIWREIFIYDYEAGHRMEAEDFRRRFARCFEMNCLSVQEQYHDAEPFTDEGEHMDAYRAGYAIGREAARNVPKLTELIYNLRAFFGSCLYQIENRAYLFYMQAFFNEIIVALLGAVDLEDDRHGKSWDLFGVHI